MILLTLSSPETTYCCVIEETTSKRSEWLKMSIEGNSIECRLIDLGYISYNPMKIVNIRRRALGRKTAK